MTMKKNKPAPFPFPAPAKRAPKPRVEADPDLMTVEHNQPVPYRRTRTSNKYAALLAKMRPGSCIRCEASETDLMARVLRKELKRGRAEHLAGCTVVSRKRCPDGHGRVWAMPPKDAR